MMRRILLLCMSIFFCLLSACHDQTSDQKKNTETIVTAKMQKPVERLYYSGSLKPITMNSILSPVAGRIAKVYFSYGQYVKKGQPLFAIDSSGLTQDFRKSIADYLQKKSAYQNSQEEFRGSTALYKAGVISRQEFISSRSKYRNDQLSYYQSQYAMEKILVKAGVDPRDIEELTLEDTGKINHILQKQFKHILVRSDADGIALFPIKSASHDENGGDDKQVESGSSVKQGQLLLMIGDLNGMSTEIHVNEVNVNRIHKGMSAVVTGSAFPGIRLKAFVDSVSSQAKNSQGSSSVSEFPVQIKIPAITKKERDIIHVGMSAKVELQIAPDPSILLPINAVYVKDGRSMVTIISKQGKRIKKPVIIGFTTPTQVSIASGVKPGDKVVVSEDA